MELLNIISIILGIVVSILTIIGFWLQHRSHFSGRSKEVAEKDYPIKIRASTMNISSGGLISGESERSGLFSSVSSGFSKIIAGFWGFLGISCILEGFAYGNLFLIVLGALFLYFARNLWPNKR